MGLARKNSLLKHPRSKEHFRKRVKGESRVNEKPNASFQSPMPVIRGQMDQRFSRPRQPGRRPLPLSCLTNPRRLMQSAQEERLPVVVYLLLIQ